MKHCATCSGKGKNYIVFPYVQKRNFSWTELPSKFPCRSKGCTQMEQVTCSFSLKSQNLVLFTNHVRSARENNVFTRERDSAHRGLGIDPPWTTNLSPVTSPWPRTIDPPLTKNIMCIRCQEMHKTVPKIANICILACFCPLCQTKLSKLVTALTQAATCR